MSSSSAAKVRPSNQDPSSKGKFISSTKPQQKQHQFVDSKNKSLSKTIKPEEKGKTATSSKRATTTTRKREKKVFSLPGQKFDQPEEREPLRIFYESLSKQIPSSEMAEFWLMEHGLLSPERAKKAYEKKQRKQKQLRTGTPIKSAAQPSRPESSVRQKQVSRNGDVKAKKRIADDSDDEFIGSPKRRRW